MRRKKVEDRYDDPVKQLSRIEQLKFEKKHLVSVPPSQRTVVYLPGPYDHEWWVYERQRIPPQNATGLENKLKSFNVLEKHAHGINIERIAFEDYFKNLADSESGTNFNIVSLDTEGQLTKSLQDTIMTILLNNILRMPGVLVVNIYGKREKESTKLIYKEMEGVRRSFAHSREGKFESGLEELNGNPLDFRVDSISQQLRYAIAAHSIMDGKTMQSQLEFLKEFHDPRIHLNLLNEARIIYPMCDKYTKEVLSKLLKNEISLDYALPKVNELFWSFHETLFNSLQNITHKDGKGLRDALYTALFDPIIIKGHKRFQYTSKKGANMYMDIIALDRASNSHIANYMEEIKDKIKFLGKDRFAFSFDESKHTCDKCFKKVIKSFNRKLKLLNDFLNDNYDRLANYNFIEERIELKLNNVSTVLQTISEKKPKEKPQIQEKTLARSASIYDLVPPKFYERLPESYQKRIAFFVEQINQEGIDKSVLSAVNQSKWYRKELLPKIDFYGFWDGIYLKALFDGKLSKDNVNRIWEESKTRDYTPIEDKRQLEERIDSGPIPPKHRKVKPCVDSKHPNYQRERNEIILLFDQGLTTAEVKELKPYVKPQAIAGIAAWYNHRDSWERR